MAEKNACNGDSPPTIECRDVTARRTLHQVGRAGGAVECSGKLSGDATPLLAGLNNEIFGAGIFEDQRGEALAIDLDGAGL